MENITKNPQLENGFTPIANEIMEALARTKLSSQESRLIFAILRKTYGFHKKVDWIVNSQLERMTGINRCHCSSTKKRLIERKIVTQIGNKIQFNKLYSQWKDIPKQETFPKQETMLPKQEIKNPESVTTIYTITKDTIQKIPILRPEPTAPSAESVSSTTTTIPSFTPPVYTDLKKLLDFQTGKKVETPKIIEPFDSKVYIDKLVNDKQHHVRIIGEYFMVRENKFPNKAAADLEFKRWLKPAAELANYPDGQINATYDYAAEQCPEMWNLGTVAKYVNNPRVGYVGEPGELGEQKKDSNPYYEIRDAVKSKDEQRIIRAIKLCRKSALKSFEGIREDLLENNCWEEFQRICADEKINNGVNKIDPEKYRKYYKPLN